MPLTRQGRVLLIELKLPDKNAGVFPRTRLFDEDNNELADSPVTLTHFADGLYRGPGSVTMPNVEYVTVITTVYEDAGFTKVSEDYADGVDVFELVDDLKSNVVVPRSDEIFIEFDNESDLEVSFDQEEQLLLTFDEPFDLDVFFEGGEEFEVFFGEQDTLDVDLDC